MLHCQLGYIGLATTFLLASFANAQNPICYVCGGDPDATISNPDALIDIPPEFNLPVTQASCFQVFQAGLSNLIPAEACDLIVEDIDAQIFCGCSNIATPVAAPVAAPEPVPVDTPSPITAPVDTPAPVDVPIDTPTPVAAPVDTPGVTPAPLATDPPVLPTPVATLPPGETAKPSLDDGGTECSGKGKGGMMGMSDKGKGMGKGMGMGKGNDDSSASGKGKGGMMMGKKCKKVPKEPKTPKVGKGME